MARMPDARGEPDARVEPVVVTSLFTWGAVGAGNGQLGYPTGKKYFPRPKRVDFDFDARAPGTSGRGVRLLAAGKYHTAVVVVDGENRDRLFTYGAQTSRYPRLGRESGDECPVEVQMVHPGASSLVAVSVSVSVAGPSRPRVERLCCGRDHTVFAFTSTSGSPVYGFGSNEHGQLIVDPKAAPVFAEPTMLPFQKSVAAVAARLDAGASAAASSAGDPQQDQVLTLENKLRSSNFHLDGLACGDFHTAFSVGGRIFQFGAYVPPHGSTPARASGSAAAGKSSSASVVGCSLHKDSGLATAPCRPVITFCVQESAQLQHETHQRTFLLASRQGGGSAASSTSASANESALSHLTIDGDLTAVCYAHTNADENYSASGRNKNTQQLAREAEKMKLALAAARPNDTAAELAAATSINAAQSAIKRKMCVFVSENTAHEYGGRNPRRIRVVFRETFVQSATSAQRGAAALLVNLQREEQEDRASAAVGGDEQTATSTVEACCECDERLDATPPTAGYTSATKTHDYFPDRIRKVLLSAKRNELCVLDGDGQLWMGKIDRPAAAGTTATLSSSSAGAPPGAGGGVVNSNKALQQIILRVAFQNVVDASFGDDENSYLLIADLRKSRSSLVNEYEDALPDRLLVKVTLGHPAANTREEKVEKSSLLQSGTFSRTLDRFEMINAQAAGMFPQRIENSHGVARLVTGYCQLPADERDEVGPVGSSTSNHSHEQSRLDFFLAKVEEKWNASRYSPELAGHVFDFHERDYDDAEMTRPLDDDPFAFDFGGRVPGTLEENDYMIAGNKTTLGVAAGGHHQGLVTSPGYLLELHNAAGDVAAAAATTGTTATSATASSAAALLNWTRSSPASSGSSESGSESEGEVCSNRNRAKALQSTSSQKDAISSRISSKKANELGRRKNLAQLCERTIIKRGMVTPRSALSLLDMALVHDCGILLNYCLLFLHANWGQVNEIVCRSAEGGTRVAPESVVDEDHLCASYVGRLLRRWSMVRNPRIGKHTQEEYSTTNEEEDDFYLLPGFIDFEDPVLRDVLYGGARAGADCDAAVTPWEESTECAHLSNLLRCRAKNCVKYDRYFHHPAQARQAVFCSEAEHDYRGQTESGIPFLRRKDYVPQIVNSEALRRLLVSGGAVPVGGTGRVEKGQSALEPLARRLFLEAARRHRDAVQPEVNAPAASVVSSHDALDEQHRGSAANTNVGAMKINLLESVTSSAKTARPSSKKKTQTAAASGARGPRQPPAPLKKISRTATGTERSGGAAGEVVEDAVDADCVRAVRLSLGLQHQDEDEGVAEGMMRTSWTEVQRKKGSATSSNGSVAYVLNLKSGDDAAALSGADLVSKRKQNSTLGQAGGLAPARPTLTLGDFLGRGAAEKKASRNVVKSGEKWSKKPAEAGPPQRATPGPAGWTIAAALPDVLETQSAAGFAEILRQQEGEYREKQLQKAKNKAQQQKQAAHHHALVVARGPRRPSSGPPQVVATAVDSTAAPTPAVTAARKDSTMPDDYQQADHHLVQDPAVHVVVKNTAGCTTSTKRTSSSINSTSKQHDPTRNAWGLQATAEEKAKVGLSIETLQEAERREQEEAEIAELEARFAALELAERLDREERENNVVSEREQQNATEPAAGRSREHSGAGGKIKGGKGKGSGKKKKGAATQIASGSRRSTKASKGAGKQSYNYSGSGTGKSSDG